MHRLIYWLQGEPQYCDCCGEKLERDETFSRFNRHSGEPTHKTVTIACPERNGFDGESHAYYCWEERIWVS